MYHTCMRIDVELGNLIRMHTNKKIILVSLSYVICLCLLECLKLTKSFIPILDSFFLVWMYVKKWFEGLTYNIKVKG